MGIHVGHTHGFPGSHGYPYNPWSTWIPIGPYGRPRKPLCRGAHHNCFEWVCRCDEAANTGNELARRPQKKGKRMQGIKTYFRNCGTGGNTSGTNSLSLLRLHPTFPTVRYASVLKIIGALVSTELTHDVQCVQTNVCE